MSDTPATPGAGPAEPDQRPPVTVLCDNADGPEALERISAHVDVRIACDETGLREALPGSRILLVTDFRTDALQAAWSAADRLEWVHAASAGVDQLMFDALVASDIPVTNAQGIFDRSIAEYVLGAILFFAKDTRNNLRFQQQRRWVHRDTETIRGQRLLIAGAGSIGREIGALCRAAGMRVTGIARRAREPDDVFEAVHASSEIDAHLPHADYVIVAAPLTPATEQWFDAGRFSAMAPHARFINIGRGRIVVTPDLVAALAHGEIAGAALDVFEAEPLPAEHPLWGMDNVLISAHMAGDFIGWHAALMDQFLQNLERWRTGHALFNQVSKRQGYAPGGG